MPGVPCEFFGGPLAGQVHSMPYPPQPAYRVPSYPRLSYALADVNESSRLLLDTEEYELGPGRGDCQYSYTWINPAASLRKEITRLHETIERQHAEKRDLENENRGLSADANKWRQFKKLTQELKCG